MSLGRDGEAITIERLLVRAGAMMDGACGLYQDITDYVNAHQEAVADNRGLMERLQRSEDKCERLTQMNEFADAKIQALRERCRGLYRDAQRASVTGNQKLKERLSRSDVLCDRLAHLSERAFEKIQTLQEECQRLQANDAQPQASVTTHPYPWVGRSKVYPEVWVMFCADVVNDPKRMMGMVFKSAHEDFVMGSYSFGFDKAEWFPVIDASAFSMVIPIPQAKDGWPRYTHYAVKNKNGAVMAFTKKPECIKGVWRREAACKGDKRSLDFGVAAPGLHIEGPWETTIVCRRSSTGEGHVADH